ncbi:MAG: SlyX family protein [Rubellimicrobium sp.]|nr:SlyX family protein [Rubellimicrobium sp.]
MSHDPHLTRLEEQIAHLTRMVEDLSDVVARQEGAITRLQRQAEMLVERELARAEAEGDPADPNQRPPHW